jgi:hypothetical protein
MFVDNRATLKPRVHIADHVFGGAGVRVRSGQKINIREGARVFHTC